MQPDHELHAALTDDSPEHDHEPEIHVPDISGGFDQVIVVIRPVQGTEIAFGPWPIQADGGHLEDIRSMLHEWHEKVGTPESTTVFGLYDPGSLG